MCSILFGILPRFWPGTSKTNTPPGARCRILGLLTVTDRLAILAGVLLQRSWTCRSSWRKFDSAAAATPDRDFTSPFVLLFIFLQMLLEGKIYVGVTMWLVLFAGFMLEKSDGSRSNSSSGSDGGSSSVCCSCPQTVCVFVYVSMHMCDPYCIFACICVSVRVCACKCVCVRACVL